MVDWRTTAIVGIGAVGGAVAIALMELLSNSSAFPLVVVPFASSIVLVMGTPDTAPARPRAVVGGHVIATLAGLVLVKIAGPAPWVAALAVGLAIVAMHATDTFHPPAGVDPLIVVVNDMSWGFVLAPVAVGALLLVGFAFLWHNTFKRGSWPAHWL